MIPVDLNRLREAREYDMTDRVQIERETADAVLDAPIVWFCGAFQRTADVELSCGGHRTFDCGWHVLVPVKGGQE